MSYPAYLRGTYPVTISIHPHHSIVQWLPFERADLIEPFMIATLTRFSVTRPQLRSISTGTETLEWLAQHEFAAPSGFVFHTSRCGSSLLVNILRAIQDSVTFPEPPPLNIIANTPFGMGYWPQIAEGGVRGFRQNLIAGIISAYTKMPSRYCFIKLNSVGTLLMPVIRKLYPQVPCIFMYREPIEVLQANLSSPPPWVSYLQEKPVAPFLFGWPPQSGEKYTTEVLLARVYAALCDAAIENASAQMLLLNYNELTPAIVPAIMQHLGVAPDTLDQEQLTKAFGTYSKDPNQSQAFVNDTARKRDEASQALRDACQHYAQAPYAQLEALRQVRCL